MSCNQRNRTRLAAGLILLLAAAAIMQPAQAAESDPVVREIFVPYQDLDVIVEAQPQRVFLSRREYLELLELAQRVPRNGAPHDVVLVSAKYDAAISQGRALISGNLTFDALSPGLHAYRLDLGQVGIQRAQLDREPAPLRRHADGSIELFVGEPGRHELELSLVARLETSAAQQTLSCELPIAPATLFELRVEGNVELRRGAAVLSRSVDEAGRSTRFELVPQRGPLDLVFSVNNRFQVDRSVAAVRSVVIDEITDSYERLYSRWSVEIVQGSLDRLRFAIPSGFEIESIDSQQLSKWEVSREGDQDVLDVSLREPATDNVTLTIAAARSRNESGEFSMPRIQPLDVHSHVSVIGLLLAERIEPRALNPSGLVPINVEVLDAVLPAIRASGTGETRAVAAYYAPHHDYTLTARFETPPPRLSAEVDSLLAVEETQLSLRSGINVTAVVEKLFAVDIMLDPSWSVASVTTADGVPLEFERFAGTGDSAARVHVAFESGIPAGETRGFYLDAHHVPATWLDEWSEARVEFPQVAIGQAASQHGQVAVKAGDDYQILLDHDGSLVAHHRSDSETSSESLLAYRYDQGPFSASLVVARKQPQITARVANFLRMANDGLVAHYELSYDIAHARARQVQFELPLATPADIAIRGIDGLEIKGYQSSVVQDWRRWTVSLAAPQRGAMRLDVDFQQRTAEELTDYVLPLARAANVDYQSSIVAVEGRADFDMELSSAGRRLDVGELADSNHRVGRYLLGVYGFSDGDGEVRIDVTARDGYGLPAAIVERCELATVVATTGLSQTAARYLLRTKASFLQVQLPRGAELWSVTVDSAPAAPQREGDQVLIHLPVAAGGGPTDLQIVYQSRHEPGTLLTEVKTEAPQLAVRNDAGSATSAVPVADVSWKLFVPAGQWVARTGGTVFRLAAVRRARQFSSVGSVLAPASRVPLASENRVVRRADVDRGAEGRAMTRALNEEDPSAAYLAMEAQGVDLMGVEARSGDVKGSADTGFLDSEFAERDAGDTESETEEAAADRDRSGYWALAGVRSLPIELSLTGEPVEFRSLGAEPRLQATLVDQPRFDYVSWTLTFGVLLAGLSFVRRPLARRIQFVVIAVVVMLVAPLLVATLTGIETGHVFARPLLACCFLVVLFTAVELFQAVRGMWARERMAAAAAALVLCCLSATIGNAQQPSRPIADWISALNPEPVELPPDAVIVPYDADLEDGIERAEKVLVPYDKYLELWSRAYPEQRAAAEQPPARFAFGGVQYETTLSSTAELLIEGSLFIETFVDDDTEIALPLQGGVLTRAMLDGRPARIRVVAPTEDARLHQAAAVPKTSPIVVVHTSGRGRKRLDFAVTMPLVRRGGWRTAAGQLPAAPASRLEITVPSGGTELLVRSEQDRVTFQSAEANEYFQTHLASSGRFELQWRPMISTGQVDPSLTVSSVNILDIQEDAIRLACRAELQMRKSERDVIGLQVPAGFLVDQIAGDNIRGWRVAPAGDGQRVEVSLLNPAAETETFTIQLSQPLVLDADRLRPIETAAVSFPGAVMHRGYLLIRRSPLIEVHSSEVAGLRRAETADPEVAGILPLTTSDSPLGLRPHQAFRFTAEGYQLELSVGQRRGETRVIAQSLLKLAAAEAAYEANLNFEVRDRAVFAHEIVLPAGLERIRVHAPGKFEWSITQRTEGSVLSVFFKSGQLGGYSVLVQGRIAAAATEGVTEAPRIEVLNVDRQEGFLVVQVDPAVEVKAEALQNCQTVSLGRVRGWLTDQQRSLAKVALHYRSADYSARLVSAPRQPIVGNFSITNVRVTPRDIETTVFVQFSILEAGIDEVFLLVPSWMRNAQVTAPQLRQVTYSEVTGEPELLRVRIEFRQPLIGELVVVLERDRAVSAGPLATRLPVVETGRANERFVVLENAGRDELVVERTAQIEELNRQESAWQKLTKVLGDGITQAFLVTDAAAEETFTVATRTRDAIKTAAARIRLAETVLVVDAHGAFRGNQVYRIDNKTEPYLEIELPAGSALWTTAVAGQLVKPAAAPGNTGRRIRIPLIKTAEGDLDYQVELKYGGQLSPVRNYGRFEFPLIHTTNINVEASQVRLRVPESHRWFDFSGTMRQVAARGELAAGLLSYQTRQIESLQQILSDSEADRFARVRAASNLRKAVDAANSYQDFAVDNYRDESAELNKKLMANSAAVEEAERQIAGSQEQLSADPTTYNRAKLRQLGRLQQANRSNNVVIQLGDNFSGAEAQVQQSPSGVEFRESWLEGNQLGSALQQQREQDAAQDRPAAPAKRQLATQPRLARPLAIEGQRDNEKQEAFKEEARDEQLKDKSDDLAQQLFRYQLQLDTRVADQSEEDQTTGFEALGGGGRWGLTLGEPAEPAVDTVGATLPGDGRAVDGLGLASLDVQLAVRGTEYLFTTPRGDIRIAARAVSGEQIDRLYHLLMICVVALAGYVAWRLVSRAQRRLAV